MKKLINLFLFTLLAGAIGCVDTATELSSKYIPSDQQEMLEPTDYVEYSKGSYVEASGNLMLGGTYSIAGDKIKHEVGGLILICKFSQTKNTLTTECDAGKVTTYVRETNERIEMARQAEERRRFDSAQSASAQNATSVQLKDVQSCLQMVTLAMTVYDQVSETSPTPQSFNINQLESVGFKPCPNISVQVDFPNPNVFHEWRAIARSSDGKHTLQYDNAQSHLTPW